MGGAERVPDESPPPSQVVFPVVETPEVVQMTEEGRRRQAGYTAASGRSGFIEEETRGTDSGFIGPTGGTGALLLDRPIASEQQGAAATTAHINHRHSH